MKHEQRFRGYRDNCQFCARVFRAETLVGLAAAVDEHEAKCGPETKAKADRDARSAAAIAAQPGLFDEKIR